MHVVDIVAGVVVVLVDVARAPVGQLRDLNPLADRAQCDGRRRVDVELLGRLEVAGLVPEERERSLHGRCLDCSWREGDGFCDGEGRDQGGEEGLDVC